MSEAATLVEQRGKVALELVFTGEPMSAHDALKWGLINKVVPDGTVVEAALAPLAFAQKRQPIWKAR